MFRNISIVKLPQANLQPIVSSLFCFVFRQVGKHINRSRSHEKLLFTNEQSGCETWVLIQASERKSGPPGIREKMLEKN